MREQNHHLNIFRFFNENDSPIFIENNLSRAFAICLANDTFFLNEYVRNVVDEEDYEYLFDSITDDSECLVNIQIDTATIDKDLFKTVYAVAMTTDKHLDMSNFFALEEISDKKNITDILITIKDIAIIIEVKRTGEDCRIQLYNQTLPFIKDKTDFRIVPKSFSWQEVMKLMERIKHVNALNQKAAPFIEHFLELGEIKYPQWFDPKPFKTLPFSSQHGSFAYIQLQQRIRQALTGISAIAGDKYQVLPFSDRLSLSVPFLWATELIPDFETYSASKEKEFVVFYIWPGNTKEQGRQIFSRPLDWINKKSLLVDGAEYEMEISYNVKFSHFMGKYISQINYYTKDVTTPLHTEHNFNENSGKWDRKDWPSLEKLFDEHFLPSFNWRSHAQWEESFVNTGKNYAFISFGFEVAVYVPYSKFVRMDTKESDVTTVSNFIFQVASAMQNLI